MKKSFFNNWKMYGININGFQVIPCYYDVLRFLTSLFRLSYKLNIINFSYIIYKFRATFDPNIDMEMAEIKQNERPLGRYLDYGRGFES
jgi:hypothetical protein